MPVCPPQLLGRFQGKVSDYRPSRNTAQARLSCPHSLVTASSEVQLGDRGRPGLPDPTGARRADGISVTPLSCPCPQASKPSGWL